MAERKIITPKARAAAAYGHEGCLCMRRRSDGRTTITGERCMLCKIANAINCAEADAYDRGLRASAKMLDTEAKRQDELPMTRGGPSAATVYREAAGLIRKLIRSR